MLSEEGLEFVTARRIKTRVNVSNEAEEESRWNGGLLRSEENKVPVPRLRFDNCKRIMRNVCVVVSILRERGEFAKQVFLHLQESVVLGRAIVHKGLQSSERSTGSTKIDCSTVVALRVHKTRVDKSVVLHNRQHIISHN